LARQIKPAKKSGSAIQRGKLRRKAKGQKIVGEY